MVREIGKVKLRYGTITSVKKIIQMLTELDRPTPKNKLEYIKFRKTIRKYIRLGGKYSGIIIAISGMDIVRLVSFVILDRLNQPKQELWIPDLVVTKEYRNRGVGKLLMRKCELIAKRKKCYRIRLESRSDRKGSHEFYKKIGFEPIALVFEKRL